jgi:hypothetical protein
LLIASAVLPTATTSIEADDVRAFNLEDKAFRVFCKAKFVLLRAVEAPEASIKCALPPKGAGAAGEKTGAAC